MAILNDAGQKLAQDIFTKMKGNEDALASKLPWARKIILTADGQDTTTLKQTVTVSGVIEDDSQQLIQVGFANDSVDTAVDAGVLCDAQGTDTLTFKTSSIPTVDLTCYAVITNYQALQHPVVYGSTSEAMMANFATKNDLDAANTSISTLNKGFANIWSKIYPVGSIYMSVNSTSPADLFGGTWEQLKDRFLLGAGDSYSAGSTGGEATHTLTVDEMPSHYHSYAHNILMDIGTHGGWGSSIITVPSDTYLAQPNNSSSSVIGGSKAHNNLPPYLTIYMWKRIA